MVYNRVHSMEALHPILSRSRASPKMQRFGLDLPGERPIFEQCMPEKTGLVDLRQHTHQIKPNLHQNGAAKGTVWT